MKLVVGLGNPGPQYADTRHNVGYDVVDRLAARWNAALTQEKFHAWFAQTEYASQRVVLLKPTTYMNRSGQAVLAAGRFYKIELSDLLVITDDMALPLGRLRMRAGGSAGGHNGLQDIIDRLGRPDWARLRIGIGAPIANPSRYVLTPFAVDERPIIERAADVAADAAACWLEHGVDLAMTRFNGDPTPPSAEGDTAPR